MTKHTSNTHTYRVTPRVLIFIRHQDQVLLIKGAPDKRLWANQYNGIGGHVEPNETVLQAARREILEETGLSDISELRLCGMVNISAPQPDDPVMLFIFTGWSPTATTHDSREGSLHWFNWDNLPAGEMVQDLPLILPLIKNQHQGGVFFASSTFTPTGRTEISFDTTTV